MIRFVLGLLPWWLWAAILGGLLACAGVVTWRTATGVERAKWQSLELKRQQAGQDARREDSRIARAASAEFERWRADRDRRYAKVAKELKDALQSPVSCPPSGRLADVAIPAAVVDGLRRAGSDPEPVGAPAR